MYVNDKRLIGNKCVTLQPEQGKPYKELLLE